jgi:molybdate transport system substrate-binding protein
MTISVAAGLTDVVTDLAKRYEAAGGPRVAVSAAASNALARQIADGAPVDLFISADEAQMDIVDRAGRLVAGSRKPLLSNQLVIVVARDGKVAVSGPHDLTRAAVQRVAVGRLDAEPAGVHGRQWLEKQGLWRAVQSKVVPLPSVGDALAAVKEGRVDAAIVYSTDARRTPEVRVAYTHTGADPRIVYPAAVVKGPRQNDAIRFLAYLRSREALAVFEAAGFRIAINFI